jgi:hypothetical protein
MTKALLAFFSAKVGLRKTCSSAKIKEGSIIHVR